MDRVDQQKVEHFAQFMQKEFLDQDVVLVSDLGLGVVQFTEGNFSHLVGMKRSRHLKGTGPPPRLFEDACQGNLDHSLSDYYINAKYGQVKIDALPDLENCLDGGYIALYKGEDFAARQAACYLVNPSQTKAIGLCPGPRLPGRGSYFKEDERDAGIFIPSCVRDLTLEDVSDYEMHPVLVVTQVKEGERSKARYVREGLDVNEPVNARPLQGMVYPEQYELRKQKREGLEIRQSKAARAYVSAEEAFKEEEVVKESEPLLQRENDFDLDDLYETVLESNLFDDTPEVVAASNEPDSGMDFDF